MGAAGTDGMASGAAGAARSCLEKTRVVLRGWGVPRGCWFPVCRDGWSQCRGLQPVPRVLSPFATSPCPTRAVPRGWSQTLQQAKLRLIAPPCPPQPLSMSKTSPLPHTPPGCPQLVVGPPLRRGVWVQWDCSPHQAPQLSQCCPSQGTDHAAAHHCNEFCLPSASQSSRGGDSAGSPLSAPTVAGPHRVTALPRGLASLCRGVCLCLTPTILGG